MIVCYRSNLGKDLIGNQICTHKPRFMSPLPKATNYNKLTGNRRNTMVDSSIHSSKQQYVVRYDNVSWMNTACAVFGGFETIDGE